jgi:hypothetical protein
VMRFFVCEWWNILPSAAPECSGALWIMKNPDRILSRKWCNHLMSWFFVF